MFEIYDFSKASLKDWAHFYASNNWPILPLYAPLSKDLCSCRNQYCKSIGKHPRSKNGLLDASTDHEKIEMWWKMWPNANIGIETGIKSGIFVIDIDPRHGGDNSLKKLQESLKAPKVITGGNGLHYYYSSTESHSLIKNRVNILPGIDVRGQGGYIIAPPSKHAMGNNYIWENNPPAKMPVPPNWLVQQITTKKKQVSKKSSNNQTINEGGRNSFLLSMGGVLRKHGFNQEIINQELIKINDKFCSPCLEEVEIQQISNNLGKYSSENSSWPKLKTIPDLDFSAPFLKEEYIPGQIKDWILDTSNRMQVSPEFLIAPTIVALSSVIGRKVKIYPKKNDSWQVVTNLWGGIIARPGTFKSPAISEALAPLEVLVQRENKIFEEKFLSWEIKKEISSASTTAIKEQLIKAIKAGKLENIDELKQQLEELTTEINNSMPICKRYKTNDATVEKLSQILLENPEGILLLRDELAGWLCALQKHGREGDREFYLESWNGYGSYTVDRIGRGTVHIPALCLSIFGGIQPDKLQKFLTGALENNDDGLLQRFQILIYPEIKKEWRNIDLVPNQEAKNRVQEIFDRINNIENTNHTIHFSNEAQLVFDNWRENLEKVLRSEEIKNEAFESHLAKFRSLMPSLALIFYILKRKGDIDFSSDHGIDNESTLLAINWCEFLKLHAQKIYQIHHNQTHLSIKSLIEKIKSGRIGDRDSLRSIQRHGWTHLKTAKDIKEGVLFLAKYGWAKLENESKGQRESLIIRINPCI